MSEDLSAKAPFSPGDEVESNYKGCEKNIFVVVRVHTSDSCASKFLVVAHLKGDTTREIRGTTIDGINYGIDSGWFRKVL